MSFDPNLISVIIPSYKRPEPLRRALGSLVVQKVSNKQIEIIIIDNDPAGSAHDTAQEFIQKYGDHIAYVRVTEPGVANARNGGLEVAKGRYILFLDDDMEASPQWAQGLINTAQKYKAGLAFGPVTAVLPEDLNPAYKFMQPLFCRDIESEDGLVPRGLGTGGCLLDRGRVNLPSPVFEIARNETGGEDDALFRQLEAQGVGVAWTNAALSYEHVPKSRATLKYLWRRNFAFGQSPAQEAADTGLRGLPEIIKWMTIGIIQTGLYGGLSLISRLINHPKYVFYLGRMAQGVGKIFWTDNFAPKLYGN